MADALCDQLFADVDGELPHHSDADDLFGILEAWEDCVTGAGAALSPCGVDQPLAADAAVANGKRQRDCEDGTVQAPKRQRSAPVSSEAAETGEEGMAKMTSHITVERNRRKQMNENLAVLRSLMPCFYVKRGDQASIIGGVVDYIKEMQQVLQSLEAKKHRKAYTDQVILSPRPPACCSPRPPLPLKSTPPMSPRLAVPISPRTPPAPGSPYKPCRKPLPPLPLPLSPPGSAYVSPSMTPTHESAASSYLPSLDAIATELCAYAANKQQAVPAAAGGVPDVKVEFSGANLVVKTVSHRAPGQAVKVIAALEGRSLEILHAKISTVDDTAVNSFTIKIGIECELSAEELVQEIQQNILNSSNFHC
ncbi:transcription factor SPEECHLESS-like [Phragmites australis]|uniref:transcription factor SPEECHLESS-like n=1 Tax=Phragmites australis TaxID=29695 RepID=UPI002D77EF75|nr:transcription factor SPEECHLESS-like [Phragmites australis]